MERSSREHFTSVLMPVVAVCLFGACSGRAPSVQSPVSKTNPVVERVEIPQADILVGDFETFERMLKRLPDEHPDRMILRDRLVDILIDRFNKTSVARREERLDIFHEVLSLYAPADLIPYHLGADLEPMMQWVSDTFEPRGNEANVITALTVQTLLRPDDWRFKERLKQTLQWSSDARSAMASDIERVSSMVKLFEEIVSILPVRWAVNRLSDLYLEQYQVASLMLEALGKDDSKNPLGIFQAVGFYDAQQKMSLRVMVLYIRVLDYATALKILEPLGGMPGVPEEHLKILKSIVSSSNPVDALIELAEMIGPVDPDAGLKVCIFGKNRGYDDLRLNLCAAKFYEIKEDWWGAWEEYLHALERYPDDSDVLIEAVKLLERALIVSQEEEDPAKPVQNFRLAEKILTIAKNQKDKSPEVAGVLSELRNVLGQLAFDAGEIDLSMKYLNESNREKKNIDALVQMGLIAAYRDQREEALRLYTEALELAENEGFLDKFWARAQILERMGDVNLDAGEQRRAAELYGSALKEWENINRLYLRLPSNSLPKNREVELIFRQGVLLSRLGRDDLAMQSFRMALRIQPDRRSTYATLLSLFTTEGKVSEANEIYQLTYNHDGIPTTWKIYYSLWLRGLLKRLHAGENPLAEKYLEQVEGVGWASSLAEYATGKFSYEELLKRAKNKGETAEAHFYHALDLLAEGRKEEAVALFQSVLQSEMMGFFEYQMAHRLLRGGLKE